MFLDLVENDPDQVEDILNESVRDRIDENRLSERWPAILDSFVDGVETWDLTGSPSERALGIAEDSRAGIHETDEPRPVVLLLPEDTRVGTTAKVLSFERARTAGGEDRFRIGLRGPTVPADELVDQLRSVGDQLGVASPELETFSDELAAAPADQTERIRFASPATELGDLTVSVPANVAPIAEAGRLVIGGVWG